MTNTEFYTSMKAETKDFKEILTNLYQGVIDTNVMIGIGKEGKSEEEIVALKSTYEKLCHEEGKELKVAVGKYDRVEYLDAVVDYLVVGGYLAHLQGNSIERLTSESYLKGLVPMSLSGVTELFIECIESENWFAALINAQDIFMKLNIDHQLAVDTVLESNTSKFPTETQLVCGYNNLFGFTGNVNYTQWQCDYIESQGRYTGVHVKELIDPEGVPRYSFWCTRDKGKVKLKYVKPITFVEPSFADCWLN